MWICTHITQISIVYWAVDEYIAVVAPLRTPGITTDIVIACWVSYETDELNCVVDGLPAGVEYTWFIEDEVDVCGDNHWNGSLLEDIFELWAASVYNVAAADWKMWHFGGIKAAWFGCLLVGIKVLKSYPCFYDVLISIRHHASGAADVSVGVAAVY